MLVPLNFKQIARSIRFPVYELPSEDVYSSDGILFFNEKVLDDRNQPGKSLGERRLTTPHQKQKLVNFFPSFLDMVKGDRSLFIDSNGSPFRYEKTKFCRVEARKINKKISRETYSIIYVDGVTNLYKVDRYPKAEDWALILMLDNMPWLLYGLSENQIDNFRKKI